MNTLLDITKKYGIIFTEEYNVHEREIVDIFNTGNINSEITNEKILNVIGLYYAHVKNNELAVKYYLMAAEKGNVYSMNTLGYYYEEHEHNYVLSVKYYLMAIEKGCSASMNNLGYYYFTVEKNYELALKYYLMAIEKGDYCAMNNLGNYYCNVVKNYKLAKRYYLRAIKGGNCYAMNNLAYYYANVLGNYEVAVKYYLMAIDAGNVRALNNLGCYYDKVEKNYELAVKYYMMAVKKGDSCAMDNISHYYETVENNYELAFKYKLMEIENAHGLSTNLCNKIHECLSLIDKFALVNDTTKNAFITCYNKFQDKFDSYIESAGHIEKAKILHILGKPCNCVSCVNLANFEYKKIHFGKLAACDICMDMELKQCIPYNNLAICPHFTCVDCHMALKTSNSNCPFCRQ